MLPTLDPNSSIPQTSKPIIPSSPPSTFGGFRPQTPQKPSSAPILTVVVLALALGAGYYFFVYKSADLSSLPTVVPLTAIDQKISNMSRLSFDLLDSPAYKSLRDFGILPITVDSLGRSNPFIPY